MVLLITMLMFDIYSVVADVRSIRVSGSTTVLPVVAKTSEIFMSILPDVRIMVNPGGSGVGVKFVGNNLADIGMISRRLQKKRLKVFQPVILKYMWLVSMLLRASFHLKFTIQG